MDSAAILEQLRKLKVLLSSPTTDVMWSTFETPEEVILTLVRLENGVLNEDQASVRELLFLLAPTGALQEISISSGWGEEFLCIAESIEIALGVVGK